MSWSGTPTGPGEITPADAHRLAQDGHAVLLDVRDPEEYADGHAPGAVLLPLALLAAGASIPPPHRTVLTVCRSGNRSRTAAEILAARGLDTLNVTGGMHAWQQAGLPSHPAADCSCGPAT